MGKEGELFAYAMGKRGRCKRGSDSSLFKFPARIFNAIRKHVGDDKLRRSWLSRTDLKVMSFFSGIGSFEKALKFASKEARKHDITFKSRRCGYMFASAVLQFTFRLEL